MPLEEKSSHSGNSSFTDPTPVANPARNIINPPSSPSKLSELMSSTNVTALSRVSENAYQDHDEAQPSNEKIPEEKHFAKRPPHPGLLATMRALDLLEPQWWGMTAYKLRLEQLASSIDEDYEREKSIWIRIKKLAKTVPPKEDQVEEDQQNPVEHQPPKYEVLTLFQFSKMDSLRRAGLALEERLKIIRDECTSLERRRNYLKTKYLSLLHFEDEEEEEKGETGHDFEEENYADCDDKTETITNSEDEEGSDFWEDVDEIIAQIPHKSDEN